MTIAATVGCLLPMWGIVACAGLQAVAYGVRAQQRGYRHFTANAIDGATTYLSFGLGAADLEAASTLRIAATSRGYWALRTGYELPGIVSSFGSYAGRRGNW